jgi:hypothetical protein
MLLIKLTFGARATMRITGALFIGSVAPNDFYLFVAIIAQGLRIFCCRNGDAARSILSVGFIGPHERQENHKGHKDHGDKFVLQDHFL